MQSDDAAIAAKAEELARGGADLETYARNVVQFTANNPMKPRRFWTLDARRALECGGSCTSRANLAAALLRARGIPARTLAHLPTWCGPLFEHWLVEYWHPHAGWVWLESSLNQFQPSPTTLVVLNVASPADENHPTSFASPRLRGVMAGAPYLSVQEISKELLPALDLRIGDDVSSMATSEVALSGNAKELAELFRSAEQRFARLPSERNLDAAGQSRADEFLAAARKGGIKQLRQALNQF